MSARLAAVLAAVAGGDEAALVAALRGWSAGDEAALWVWLAEATTGRWSRFHAADSHGLARRPTTVAMMTERMMTLEGARPALRAHAALAPMVRR